MEVNHEGKLWKATFVKSEETVRLEDEYGSRFCLKNNVWYIVRDSGEFVALQAGSYVPTTLESVYRKSVQTTQSKNKKKKNKQVKEVIPDELKDSTSVDPEPKMQGKLPQLSQPTDSVPKIKKKPVKEVNQPSSSVNDGGATGELYSKHVPEHGAVLKLFSRGGGGGSTTTSRETTTLDKSCDAEIPVQSPAEAGKGKNKSKKKKSIQAVVQEPEVEVHNQERVEEMTGTEGSQDTEIRETELVNIQGEAQSKKSKNRRKKKHTQKEGDDIPGEISEETGKTSEELSKFSPTCTEDDSLVKSDDGTESTLRTSSDLHLKEDQKINQVNSMESFCSLVFEDFISKLNLSDAATNLKINFSISKGNQLADMAVFSAEDSNKPAVTCFLSEQGKSSTPSAKPSTEPYLMYGRINVVFCFAKVGIISQLLSRIVSADSCLQPRGDWTCTDLGTFVFSLVKSFALVKGRSLIQVLVNNKDQKSVVCFSIQFPNPDLTLITCSYTGGDSISDMYDAECTDNHSFATNSNAVIAKINESCKILDQPYVGMLMKS